MFERYGREGPIESVREVSTDSEGDQHIVVFHSNAGMAAMSDFFSIVAGDQG